MPRFFLWITPSIGTGERTEVAPDDVLGYMPMRAKRLLLLLIASVVFLNTGCEKETPQTPPNSGGGNSGGQSQPSIFGVWKHPYDNLMFVSFDESGNYAYCLGANLIASGTYTRNGNTISLNNTMYGKNETLNIVSVNNSNLRLSGTVFVPNGSDGSANINMTFDKTSGADYPYSLSGTECCVTEMSSSPMFPGYHDIEVDFQFSGAYSGKRVYIGTKDGVRKTFKTDMFKYIYSPTHLYIKYINTDVAYKVIVYTYYAEVGQLWGALSFSEYALVY